MQLKRHISFNNYGTSVATLAPKGDCIDFCYNLWQISGVKYVKNLEKFQIFVQRRIVQKFVVFLQQEIDVHVLISLSVLDLTLKSLTG